MTERRGGHRRVADLDASDRDPSPHWRPRPSAATASAPLDDQVRLDLDHGTAAERTHLLAGDPSGLLIGYAHLDLRNRHLGERAPRGRARPPPRRCRRERSRGRLDATDHRPRTPASGRTGTSKAAASPRRTPRVAAGPRAAADAASARGRGGVSLPTPPDVTYPRRSSRAADEEAWVAVNAAAFAQHPEQGRMTSATCGSGAAAVVRPGRLLPGRARTATLLGSHWTKVHPARRPDGAVGEVYVVGVDPADARARARQGAHARPACSICETGARRDAVRRRATTQPPSASTSGWASRPTRST